jgi:geranylgeranyl diphosphate synthase type II
VFIGAPSVANDFSLTFVSFAAQFSRSCKLGTRPVNPATPSTAAALLARHAATVSTYLQSLRGRFPAAPAKLFDAIDYSLLAPGKRLRPALVLETHAACSPQLGTRNSQLGTPLVAAAAIELIHTFSLVHDDLPAMDDDDLRRGRPTNHKVFGDALAILAGDAMTTLAFQLLATDAPPNLVPVLVNELAHAAGPEGMIGGQVLDMQSQNLSLPLPDLQRLHQMKTGALLTCACRLGAICAYAPNATLAAVTNYARHLGLAFQIVDDLLDATSTPEQLGKATHKDAARGKNTYPALLGIDGARQEASRQITAALEMLSPLPPQADGLRALARFVIERQH